MAEENLTNTAGDAGSKNANAIDIEKIVENAFNAVLNKNVKNEHSITSSNFDKLPEDVKEKAYELYYAKKNADAEKIKKAEAEKNKEFESMQKELAAYRTKEKIETLTKKSNEILATLGCTEDGAQKQAVKLTFTGINADEYFNEDKTVKEEELKKILSSTLSDVPSLVSSKKKEVKIEIGNQGNGNSEDNELQAMLKAIGAKK